MGTYSQEVNMTQLKSQTNFYYSKNADTFEARLFSLLSVINI